MDLSEHGLLTSDEAAARLGIQRQSLYNLAYSRTDFPEPERAGRTLLWPAAELDAWRAANPARPKRRSGKRKKRRSTRTE